MNTKYIVDIAIKNSKISGILKVIENNNTVKSSHFNPALVLCDLISANKILKIENDSFNLEYYKYEKSFGIDLYVANEPQYWNIREKIYSIINSDQKSSIDLGQIQRICEIEFSHSVTTKENAILDYKELNGFNNDKIGKDEIDEIADKYKKMELLAKELPDEYFIKNNEKTDFNFLEQNSVFVEIENENTIIPKSTDELVSTYERINKKVNKAIEEQINIDNDYIYSYTCYSVAGILYSVLHYLITNKYRFLKCSHCENYFATKKRNANYCERNSKLKGYNDKSCQLAKKRSLNALSERYNDIRDRLEDTINEEGFKKFKKEYKKYRDIIFEKPTIKNIEKLTNFLKKENIKEFRLKYKVDTVSDYI
ncbi:MAG: hypothetical protein LBM96_07020 [Methanobrevibacter sp.]|jgi:hypothetical protein|nr:hypothetical protein [Candidatus Methanoflexus mossambicus]